MKIIELKHFLLAVLLSFVFLSSAFAQSVQHYYWDPNANTLSTIALSGYKVGNLNSIYDDVLTNNYYNIEIIIDCEYVAPETELILNNAYYQDFYVHIITNVDGYSLDERPILKVLNYSPEVKFQNCRVTYSSSTYLPYISFQSVCFEKCTIGEATALNRLELKHHEGMVINQSIINQALQIDWEFYSILSGNIFNDAIWFYPGTQEEYSTFDLIISNNTINAGNVYQDQEPYGIIITGFPDSMSVTNNTFIGGRSAIQFEDKEFIQMNNDLIIDGTVFYGNTIQDDRFGMNCYDISNSNETDAKSIVISGIDIPSPISVLEGNNPVFVSNCQIESHWDENEFVSSISVPNSNVADSRNRGIVPPIVTDYSSVLNEVAGNYEVQIGFSIDQPLFENTHGALSADNAPFVIEVYRSNYKGDLLERIGVEQYDFSQYNVAQNLVITGLEDLPDWIAVTLSAGIDVQGITSSDPIGTSEPLVLPIRNEGIFNNAICIDEVISLNFLFESPYFTTGAGLSQLNQDVDAPDAYLDSEGNYYYTTPGSYPVSFNVDWEDPNGVIHTYYSDTVYVTVLTEEECNQAETCLPGFSPTPGEYLLSAWVKEEEPAYSYENAGIMVECATGSGLTQLGPYYAQGNIIDGWQRIEQTINIPSGPGEVKIILLNNSENVNVYFDDIRIQPVDASAKAFVYDKKLGKMRATLNDNNYATFYDYDDEGKLIRQRQETERGVMTIEEVEYNTHNGLSD